MVWSCTSRDSQESSLMFKSISSSVLSLLYDPTLTSTCDCWKNHSFDYIWMFVSKVMSLLFNTLSRFVIAFLPRSKQMSFSFMAAVIICRDFGAQSFTVSIVSASICHEVMGPNAMLCFLNAEFLASFFTLLFHLHQEKKNLNHPKKSDCILWKDTTSVKFLLLRNRNLVSLSKFT